MPCGPINVPCAQMDEARLVGLAHRTTLPRSSQSVPYLVSEDTASVHLVSALDIVPGGGWDVHCTEVSCAVV